MGFVFLLSALLTFYSYLYSLGLCRFMKNGNMIHTSYLSCILFGILDKIMTMEVLSEVPIVV